MEREDLKERVDYLTSTRMITSDKYRIWRFDSIGVIAGIVFLAWGILGYGFPSLLGITLIILGAILLPVCSLRIERRYSRFKREILEEIDNSQY